MKARDPWLRVLIVGVICALLLIAMTNPAESRQRVYVADSTSALVLVIDAKTNTIVASIPVGTQPFAVAVSPDGRRLYVANRLDGTVSVIDTKTNKPIGLVNGLDLPTDLAITPDGTRVYVTNMGNTTNTVSAIDTRTKTVVATIGVGVAPFGIAITPDGGRAYVINSQSGSVSVINVATNMVLTTIQVGGGGSGGIAVTPDGDRVYVLNGGTVSVIDTATNMVEPGITPTETFYPTGQPNIGGAAIAMTPDGTLAFIPIFINNPFSLVSVVNSADNSPVAVLGVAPFLQGVGFASNVRITANGKRAYLSVPAAGAAPGLVVVIDLETNTTLAAIPTVGPVPWGIAVK